MGPNRQLEEYGIGAGRPPNRGRRGIRSIPLRRTIRFEPEIRKPLVTALRVAHAVGMVRQDPTRMRNQPALTTSSGRSWLVVGGLATVLITGTMIALWLRLGLTAALVGAIVTVVLFAAMIVVRFFVDHRRRRLGLLAVIFLAQVIFALVVVLMIALFPPAPAG
jgi:hypothetical protein